MHKAASSDSFLGEDQWTLGSLPIHKEKFSDGDDQFNLAFYCRGGHDTSSKRKCSAKMKLHQKRTHRVATRTLPRWYPCRLTLTFKHTHTPLAPRPSDARSIYKSRLDKLIIANRHLLASQLQECLQASV